MAVYHRSDIEIYDMDEDRMDAVLSTMADMSKLMFGPKL